ncbi:MAG TPA: ATP-binding protein [Polyangiaceae bacterium]|nr:ATP-binding protein [Polyangiaceae bacterium]
MTSALGDAAWESLLDFKRLFESSPDVLLVLLPDAPRYTMVAATDARLAVTHTTREATLGRGLFEVFPDNPDDTSADGTSNLRASLDRVVATCAPDTMAVQKYDIKGPDGAFQTKYWSPKNLPVLGRDGRVAFILHRVEEVTELVLASEAGEELRDRTRRMERDVVSRSRELAQAVDSLRLANARLGELDAAKTAFFSTVSHEFRTPLTLILGPLENALGRNQPALAPDELESLHRNALRLLRLVNSLLDFSRLEAGRLDLSFAATDLALLTAGLAGAFHSLMQDVGLRLVVECPPLPEPVYVDEQQWEKIVLNLVSNAFKFTFEGEVRVALSWHGDHVELSVRDTGTGIPERELPRMFERFHRVEGARGRSHEGSGIGLSLVHELARLHGGAVRVTSALGRGSEFVVSIPTGAQHLPPGSIVEAARVRSDDPAVRGQVLEAKQWLRSLDQPAAGAEALRPLSSPPAGPRKRVLVADDNADMREYLRRLLSASCDVTLVEDGQAALAAALANPPDLILSDIMMPRMDGVALLAALRAEPRTSAVPVILISARAGEEARLEVIETGADDYLVKPFAARELLARVRTHLEMADVRRASTLAAQALAEMRAELVRELELKNEQLKASYRELAATQSQLVQSAKMASLGELVAGIAHEVNNPLAFVLSHLETVERSLIDVERNSAPSPALLPSWQKAQRRLTEMKQGLSRIQELVQKLRVFSRLDEGERKQVSLRESVNSALMILQHRLAERIRVVTDFGEPDAFECYAGLLNQAILNLLTNAIDAIQGPGTIHVVTRQHDGHLTLSVSDSGGGIPAAVRERIFEPFFTTKPVGQGTGLGLSITYSIVQKHGGRIELAPSERGTTFVVTLPRAATA